MRFGTYEDREQLEEGREKAKELVPDRNRKAIRDEIADLVEGEFDRLADDAGEWLIERACHMASTFINAVLDGKEDAAKRMIDAGGGRYRSGGYDDGKPWSHLTCTDHRPHRSFFWQHPPSRPERH